MQTLDKLNLGTVEGVVKEFKDSIAQHFNEKIFDDGEEYQDKLSSEVNFISSIELTELYKELKTEADYRQVLYDLIEVTKRSLNSTTTDVNNLDTLEFINKTVLAIREYNKDLFLYSGFANEALEEVVRYHKKCRKKEGHFTLEDRIKYEVYMSFNVVTDCGEYGDKSKAIIAMERKTNKDYLVQLIAKSVNNLEPLYTVENMNLHFLNNVEYIYREMLAEMEQPSILNEYIEHTPNSYKAILEERYFITDYLLDIVDLIEEECLVYERNKGLPNDLKDILAEVMYKFNRTHAADLINFKVLDSTRQYFKENLEYGIGNEDIERLEERMKETYQRGK